MKTWLLMPLLCLQVPMACAQNQLSKAGQAFKEYSIKLEQERRSASEQKNYLRADTLLRQWLNHYDRLPDSVQQGFEIWQPGIYYNIACYETLLGHKNEALTAFEKCVSLGYKNYANTLADPDLQSLHKEKRYLAALQMMREKGDMGYILRQSGTYNYNAQLNQELPAFSYQDAGSPELIVFRNQFKLDSVAGNGDEISRIKNLLLWTHNVVRHDGNSFNPPSRNGIDLIDVCRKEGRGVNCRMMATILRDAYQAEGFKCRMVTCMPRDTLDNDCHVITAVWSNILNKWLWMDPTFNAYITDIRGKLLSIEEVREKLYHDQLDDLVLN